MTRRSFQGGMTGEDSQEWYYAYLNTYGANAIHGQMPFMGECHSPLRPKSTLTEMIINIPIKGDKFSTRNWRKWACRCQARTCHQTDSGIGIFSGGNRKAGLYINIRSWADYAEEPVKSIVCIICHQRPLLGSLINQIVGAGHARDHPQSQAWPAPTICGRKADQARILHYRDL